MFRSYALLGLQPDAAREQAREAFRRQALDFHPDVSALPAGIAEERFRAIAEAWETIRVRAGLELSTIQTDRRRCYTPAGSAMRPRLHESPG